MVYFTLWLFKLCQYKSPIFFYNYTKNYGWFADIANTFVRTQLESFFNTYFQRQRPFFQNPFTASSDKIRGNHFHFNLTTNDNTLTYQIRYKDDNFYNEKQSILTVFNKWQTHLIYSNSSSLRYISIQIFLDPVRTYPLSFENAAFSLRIRLLSTRIRGGGLRGLQPPLWEVFKLVWLPMSTPFSYQK